MSMEKRQTSSHGAGGTVVASPDGVTGPAVEGVEAGSLGGGGSLVAGTVLRIGGGKAGENNSKQVHQGRGHRVYADVHHLCEHKARGQGHAVYRVAEGGRFQHIRLARCLIHHPLQRQHAQSTTADTP